MAIKRVRKTEEASAVVKAEPKAPAKKRTATAATHRTTRVAKAPGAPVSEPIATEQIANLAYQLWLEGGCRDGHDSEDWLRAEQILTARA